MKTIFLLVAAAILEVGGDALIRAGIKGGGILLMILGAAVLVGYGFMVNFTALDFGKLMGLYIVLFFLTAQFTAVVIFHEKISLPVTIGGILVLAGGLTMALWHAP